MMGQQNVNPNDPNHEVHYHLICLKCGAIRDVKDSMLESINEHVKNEYGFSTTQTKLSLYGLCEDCERFMKKK